MLDEECPPLGTFIDNPTMVVALAKKPASRVVMKRPMSRLQMASQAVGGQRAQDIGAGLPEQYLGAGLPEQNLGAGLPEQNLGAGLGEQANVGAGLGEQANVGAGLPEQANVGAGLPEQPDVGAGLDADQSDVGAELDTEPEDVGAELDVEPTDGVCEDDEDEESPKNVRKRPAAAMGAESEEEEDEGEGSQDDEEESEEEGYDDDDDEDEEEKPIQKKPAARPVMKRPAAADVKTGDEGKEKRKKKKKRIVRRKKKKKHDGKPLRDRTKSKTFADLFDSLPGQVQEMFNSFKTRAEETEFINKVYDRKGGRLVLNKSVMFEAVMQREEQQQALQKMAGVGLEEAIAKAGGKEALEEGIKFKRIIRRKAGGLDLYFFPQWEFTRANLFKNKVQGKKAKVAGAEAWDIQMEQQLGYEWEPEKLLADMGPSGADSGSSPLPALVMPGFSGDAAIGGDGGMAQDSDIKQLQQQLNELSKQQSIALRMINVAEGALAGSMGRSEKELLELNLEQLKQAAEQSEDISTNMSKAVKFGRLSWEGGFTSQNAKILAEQSQDVTRRLGTLARLIKAILPTNK